MMGEASLARAIATQGQVWIGCEFRSESSIHHQYPLMPKVKFNNLFGTISGRIGNTIFLPGRRPNPLPEGVSNSHASQGAGKRSMDRVGSAGAPAELALGDQQYPAADFSLGADQPIGQSCDSCIPSPCRSGGQPELLAPLSPLLSQSMQFGPASGMRSRHPVRS
jgi:hypothetical protein